MNRKRLFFQRRPLLDDGTVLVLGGDEEGTSKCTSSGSRGRCRSPKLPSPSDLATGVYVGFLVKRWLKYNSIMTWRGSRRDTCLLGGPEEPQTSGPAGARQTGKTWLVTEFGGRFPDQLATVDLEREPDLAACFAPNDPKRFLGSWRHDCGGPSRRARPCCSSTRFRQRQKSLQAALVWPKSYRTST